MGRLLSYMHTNLRLSCLMLQRFWPLLRTICVGLNTAACSTTPIIADPRSTIEYYTNSNQQVVFGCTRRKHGGAEPVPDRVEELDEDRRARQWGRQGLSIHVPMNQSTNIMNCFAKIFNSPLGMAQSFQWNGVVAICFGQREPSGPSRRSRNA